MKGLNKYSIEHKMLLSFLTLFILAMILAGAFSYWSTYQLYKETMLIKFNETTEYLHGFYEYLLDLEERQKITTQEAQAQFLQMVQSIYEDSDIKITTKEGAILLEQTEGIQPDSIFAQEIIREEYLAWGWLIQSSIVINPLAPFLIDIQKYTIILVIMTSMIVIQIIIGLSHHFAQPIKELVESVEKIDVNIYPEVRLSGRKDEIGILYQAFSNMLLRLKKSQFKIMKMQKLQKSIIESTSFGIISVTYPSEQLLMNQAAKQIFKKEYKLFRLNKSPIKQGLFYKVKEVARQTWQEKKEQSTLYTREHEQNRFVVELQTKLLYGEDNKEIGVLCNLQDITEKVELEERMIRLDRLVSLGELAAGIAHEIRNPLTGIKANTQVLQKRLSTLEKQGVSDATFLPFMTRIIKEINRLNQMITRLLQFAKPKESKQELIDLSAIITDTLPIISKQLEERCVQIIREEQPGLLFLFDYDQLKQIIINLLLNAIQASANNSQIVIKTGLRGDIVFLAIEDFGKGMDTQTLQKIFNPFFTTNPSGTGLGLSVVHRLVEENEAQISVYSQPGVGTRVEIAKKKIKKGDTHDKNSDDY